MTLSAVGLHTAEPVFDMPDFTEHRIVIRPFPKDGAERRCYQYLLQEMQAHPVGSPHKKAWYKRVCRDRFRVTAESFKYCWREGLKVSGADWDRRGRRPRQKI